MDPQEGRYLLLAGEPPKPDHGMWATVSVEMASGLNDGSERQAFERLGAGAFLAAPFVRILGERGKRRLVVGQVRVAVAADEKAAVTVVLQAAWSESGGWHQVPNSFDHADETVTASLMGPAHYVTGDLRHMAVIAANAIAEGSRNEVLKLRGLRYELERQAADLLAHRKSIALRPLLAGVIELSTAIGRARDQAREAVREGLWIWLWDSDTYERNRTENNRAADAPAWGSTHRTAVRHCEAIDVYLAEESSRLHDLLNSMSTFAVAQDGETQQKFNLIAAVAAAGLGLPALILSLYGADSFLPLDSFDRAWRALLPIAVATLIAIAVVLRRMPGRSRPRHYILAAGLVATLVVILLFAGVLAPAP
jgi:hypothetical protein